MAKLQCQRCGAAVTRDHIARDAECEGCRADLRSCLNCRHYDPRYNNSCLETEADPVADKDRRNFCEFFSFNPDPFAAASTARADDARARLDALFGGPGPAEAPTVNPLDAIPGGGPAPGDRAAAARAGLDALFKPGPGKPRA